MVCSLLSLLFLTFPDFFSQFWVSPVSLPSHPSFLCILSLLFITFCRDVLAMPAWCLIAIGDIHPVFFLITASIRARVFSRLARSTKSNLTVPSSSASWPISAIHWHAYSIWGTLFSVLASIPHSLSGSQVVHCTVEIPNSNKSIPYHTIWLRPTTQSHLAAANYPSLCVLSLLLSMPLCVIMWSENVT